MPVTQPAWPYAANLRKIRGGLSMEAAARKVGDGVSSQSWNAWEKGRQVPRDEKLKKIVEAFGCPPEMVGYTPPEGWVLVPVEWLRVEFRELHAKLDEALRRIPAR